MRYLFLARGLGSGHLAGMEGGGYLTALYFAELSATYMVESE